MGFFCDITNNVMYDWGRGYAVKNADKDELCTINLVNNYMIAGRSSNASNFMLDRNLNSRMYFEGNYMNGKLPANQYKKISYLSYINPLFFRARKAKDWKLKAPFDGGMSRLESTGDAYARVMKYGGASLQRDSFADREARLGTSHHRQHSLQWQIRSAHHIRRTLLGGTVRKRAPNKSGSRQQNKEDRPVQFAERTERSFGLQ